MSVRAEFEKGSGPTKYTKVIDSEAIERWTVVGEALPLGEDPVCIYVVQRDDLDWSTNPAKMSRNSPTVLALDRHFTAAAARQLAESLLMAADLVDDGVQSVTANDRPQR
jgi:hypothetical protein